MGFILECHRQPSKIKSKISRRGKHGSSTGLWGWLLTLGGYWIEFDVDLIDSRGLRTRL